MHPSDDQPRDKDSRFSARPRKEPSLSLAEERTRKTLDGMRGLYCEAQEIVEEGEESFFAEDNLRTRRAATALIIHLADAAHRKEIVAVHDLHPDIGWSGLKKQRDFLGHKYHDTDFAIVWNTICIVFPRERELLGLG